MLPSNASDCEDYQPVAEHRRSAPGWRAGGDARPAGRAHRGDRRCGHPPADGRAVAAARVFGAAPQSAAHRRAAAWRAGRRGHAAGHPAGHPAARRSSGAGDRDQRPECDGGHGHASLLRRRGSAPIRTWSPTASPKSSCSRSSGAISPPTAPRPPPRSTRPGAPRSATAPPNSRATATSTPWSRTTAPGKSSRDVHPDAPRPALAFARGAR